MKLIINDKEELIEAPDLTVRDLLNLKNIPEGGTAVAVNGKLCTKDKWVQTSLHDGDEITLITAAYGG